MAKSGTNRRLTPGLLSRNGTSWWHRRRESITVLVLVLVAAACGSEDVDAAALDFRSPATDTLRLIIAKRVAEDQRPADVGSHVWDHVRAIYASIGNDPLWIAERGLSDRARILLREVAGAYEDGLRPGDYPLRALESRLNELQGAGDAPVEQAVQMELLLTSVLASYGEEMMTGRIDPRQVEQSWYIDRSEVDIDSALVRVVEADDFEAALQGLRPADQDYAALRRELARYREIARAGGWREVPSGSVLAPGDSGDRVSAIRSRLVAEGLISASAGADSLRYDESLAGAVHDFQRRYGIASDSLVGPETRRTMNVPAERRVFQIEANLERWRWLPHAFGSRYIVVNVPAFRLQAYEDGEQVMDMAVIVGEEYTATPAFADSMGYLEFYPYWNIPVSIARRSILPLAARDPGYLARNNYEIVRTWEAGARPIPASSLSREQLRPGNFPYRLRQAPGPTNALGLVKFMFPNEFAIYLHDTPATELFDRRVRTFSNGCIRVENPVGLARWVLEANGGWDEGRIRSAMQGPTRRVDLERKVPIFIVYLTTYVQDGRIRFRPDVYGRDAPLIEALEPVALNPRTSERVRELAEMIR